MYKYANAKCKQTICPVFLWPKALNDARDENCSYLQAESSRCVLRGLVTPIEKPYWWNHLCWYSFSFRVSPTYRPFLNSHSQIFVFRRHCQTDWLSSDKQIEIPRWPLFAPRLPCSRWFSMNIEWSTISESIKAPGRLLNVLMSTGIWVLLHIHLLGHPPYWKPRQPGSIESLIILYMIT